MSRQSAMQRMLAVWLSATILLGLCILAQMLAGKYGEDTGVPWTWVSSQIAPVLGLLLAATFSSPTNTWKEKSVTDSRYLLAMASSLVQILALILTIAIEPILLTSPFELFDKTIGLLSIWQGVVTACVGGLVFDGR